MYVTQKVVNRTVALTLKAYFLIIAQEEVLTSYIFQIKLHSPACMTPRTSFGLY